MKIELDQAPHARRAQPFMVAALHDPEQRPLGRRFFEGTLAALGPTQRQLHCTIDFGVLGRKPHAFVKLHRDIGAEQDLHLDRALRRQLDHRAIDMRAECDARLAHLAQRRERHDLIAAGIGKDRQRPVHEFV